MTSIDEAVEHEERTPPVLLLTKLHPPAARKQTVPRERLLERLQPAPGVKLIVVAAPAGSGKTTLLGAWLQAEADRRAVGWVSLDDGDNDPVVLWSHVLEALQRVCPTLRGVRRPDAVGAARITEAVLPDLANALAEQGDVALVLDDFHRLRAGAGRDGVAWLIEHAPSSFHLVLSTRSEPALPLGALRAHGELLELRADELGFSADEARLLLNDRLDLGLAGDDVDGLVERTEGWPAGLYLAALSLRGAEDRHELATRFGGTSRHVVDFLVDEVLEAHDPSLQSLMLRCSVLDRVCGPLGDAVLGVDGSSDRLTELARTNLFLVPLDDEGRWFRFHHLFGQLLRVELERREPGLAAALHRRAFAWHLAHGSTDEAIRHALEAGAFAEAGDLICAEWPRYINLSRHATVLAWLERFPPEMVAANAVLLTVKAWVLSMLARREEAQAAIAAAERLDGLDAGPLPDGASSVAASIATLQAMLPFGDVRSGYEHAQRAARLEPPEARYWPRVCWAHGQALFFLGAPLEAEPWFAEAARLGPASKTWIATTAALAYLSLIAGDRGDLERQGRLADQADRVMRQHSLGEIVGVVPLAVAAWRAARGELEQARPLLQEGRAVLRGYGQPLHLAHLLIRQAPVLTALGEHDAAAGAIAEARATVDACADPGILEDWVRALEAQQAGRPAPHDEGAGLSERESTVLRALTGPLSERDIARELYLSHNTVHSHTRSIYRKLGVSSRRDAIQRARELGLL